MITYNPTKLTWKIKESMVEGMVLLIAQSRHTGGLLFSLRCRSTEDAEVIKARLCLGMSIKAATTINKWGHSRDTYYEPRS